MKLLLVLIFTLSIISNVFSFVPSNFFITGDHSTEGGFIWCRQFTCPNYKRCMKLTECAGPFERSNRVCEKICADIRESECVC